VTLIDVKLTGDTTDTLTLEILMGDTSDTVTPVSLSVGVTPQHR
jgi:hypothetical protein